MQDLINPDYIFETSWEVCNKVGGIYTALSTRARTLSAEYKNNLMFLGPDVWGGANNQYFSEKQNVLRAWKKHLKETTGLSVKVGRWNIPGKPMAFLVDYKPLFEQKNQIYSDFWSYYGLDSLRAYGDYDDSSMFAYAVGMVIENYCTYHKIQDKKIVAHFNEWQTAFGELYLKKYVPYIGTIFTTHATSVGRSIAEHNKPLYDYLHAFKGDQMAGELNLDAKHSSEKTAAQQADCFTTVSEITAKECAQLLERKVDVVLPNGFENDFVPKNQTYRAKQKEARKILSSIAEILLEKEINKDTLFVGTSGRYEYKNKGIDVFIDALKMLNEYKDLEKDVIAFIMVPAYIKGPKKNLIDKIQNPYSTVDIDCPPLTHDLFHPEHDPVLNQLQAFCQGNKKEQKVNVVFVPSYLDENDGVFNKSYYDLLIGFDLTVFPSYYEPWGYTPLESAAFSIPTITTDLAGFGRWVLGEDTHKGIDNGVSVVHRNDSNYFSVAEAIKDILLDFSKKNTKEVQACRKKALEVAHETLWENFIVNYKKAYHIALSKK